MKRDPENTADWLAPFPKVGVMKGIPQGEVWIFDTEAVRREIESGPERAWTETEWAALVSRHLTRIKTADDAPLAGDAGEGQ